MQRSPWESASNRRRPTPRPAPLLGLSGQERALPVLGVKGSSVTSCSRRSRPARERNSSVHCQSRTEPGPCPASPAHRLLTNAAHQPRPARHGTTRLATEQHGTAARSSRLPRAAGSALAVRDGDHPHGQVKNTARPGPALPQAASEKARYLKQTPGADEAGARATPGSRRRPFAPVGASPRPHDGARAAQRHQSPRTSRTTQAGAGMGRAAPTTWRARCSGAAWQRSQRRESPQGVGP